jgi:DNA-3-methyladenine glycosylase I
MKIEFKQIFDKVESTLIQQSWFSEKDFEKEYGVFKNFKKKKRSDNDFFQMLIMIIFYSGFKAEIVEKKEKIILGHFPDFKTVSKYSNADFEKIISNSNMIKNRHKIKSCIKNAKVFEEIVTKYGSFQNYIDNFDAHSSFENLILLKEELEYRFDYLGGVTVYHFLTDIGFNVLKPDRVILRIFQRLGLIENEKQLLKAIVLGQLFSKHTEIPIRYIDIIFVKYGQQGESEKFGLKNGICLEKEPNCNVCGLISYCKYNKTSP